MLRDRSALIYSQRTNQLDQVGNPVYLYYACARPRGASIAVAVNSEPKGGHYAAGDELEQLLLAGRYTGSLDLTGADAQLTCSKYMATNCPTPRVHLFFADAKSRHGAGVFAPQGTHGLLLSSAGAAGWLVPHGSGSVQLVATSLHVRNRRLRLSPHVLDTGNITGARLRGRTLTWNSGGAARSAHLS